MIADLSKHALAYAPEYGRHGFSDHLPMAVTALRGLRVDEEKVENFAAGYVKNLKKRRHSKKAIDATHLSARLGDASVYPSALNYFVSAIENDGRAAVLAQRLPELTNAVTTAAFHGVIRTAYGLIADENLEIAAGLAYWWANAEPIVYGSNIGAASDNPDTLIDDLAAVIRENRKKIKLDQPTISARLAAVAAHPGLGALLGRSAAADVSFDDIAMVALRIYLASPDLTTLHCVTGAHAVRIICENVVMGDEAIRSALWAGICAAYAAVGAPELPAMTPAPTGAPDWRIIASAAGGAEDEHDIKFAYSCLDEARKYGRDAHYRHAAAQRLGLLS